MILENNFLNGGVAASSFGFALPSKGKGIKGEGWCCLRFPPLRKPPFHLGTARSQFIFWRDTGLFWRMPVISSEDDDTS